MSRKADREAEIASAITQLVKDEEAATQTDRLRWRSSFEMFTYGSQFPDKEEWQSQFSINKYERKVRASQGEFKRIILNNPDWYEIAPVNQADAEAAALASLMKRYLDYHLETAGFVRYASTFFMSSLLSMGVMYVGWKNLMVQNPEWVLEKTKKDREKEERGVADMVDNPTVSEMPEADDIAAQVEKLLTQDILKPREAAPPEPEVPEFIKIGTLDFQLPSAEETTWDSSVSYIEHSRYGAYRTRMKLWEIHELGKQGWFKNTKLITSRPPEPKRAVMDARVKNRRSSTRKTAQDEIDLLVYFGPLVLNGRLKKHRYFCIIANESVIIKEGEYPFWEPPGHNLPFVMAAVKEVPGRATGAGMGDNAVQLQRIYDSNWQLTNDQMRFGVLGLNIFKYSSLVDRSQLDRGVYPGAHIEVRDNPRDSFQRIEYTSNIENQVKPVQLAIEAGISDNAGVEETFSGGAQTRSRTTASEVNARIGASDRTINSAAMDLEQQFLIPVLQKALARCLQFGMAELGVNPELRNVFTEQELSYLQSLSPRRAELLNNFFRFKIKGFTDVANKQEQLSRVNEAMTIINSGGPVAAMLPVEKVVTQWIKLLGLGDLDIGIVPGSEFSLVAAENQILQAGHSIQPSPNDNDELHMNMHSQVQQPTEQIMMHMQMHQQQMQAKQQQAQAEANGQAPGQMQPGQGKPPPVQ